MRADNVQLGVEYCLTGPLAYGVEPSVARPDKVKFTVRPRPGWGTLIRFVSVDRGEKPEHASRFWRRFGWERANNEDGESFWHVNVNDNYTARTARATNAMNLPKPEKAGEVAFAFEPLKGFYPCLRWNRETGQWDESICQPAAIHRTWDEHEANVSAAQRRREEDKRARAPREFDNAITNLIGWARYIGATPEQVMERINQQW